MAANVSIDLSSSTGTLPSTFALIDAGLYDYGQLALPNYRDLCHDLGFEGLRMVNGNTVSMGLITSPSTQWQIRMAFGDEMMARAAAEGRSFGLVIGGAAGPESRPSSVNPRQATGVVATSEPYSPIA